MPGGAIQLRLLVQQMMAITRFGLPRVPAKPTASIMTARLSYAKAQY